MLYGIFGTGGCARGILPVARAQLESEGVPKHELVLIDKQIESPILNGHPVMTYETFLDSCGGVGRVAIGIADGQIRKRLATQAKQDGLEFFSPSATNVVIMDEVVFGDGACLSPFVTLTSNIQIGAHFHANLYSYVEHDCRVGDYVTLAPGAQINGNVVIEDFVYIGAGAMIRQGKDGDPLIIGRGAVVGMGAVVTRDVLPGSVVVGNPARPLRP